MAWNVAYSDLKARILRLADVENNPRHTDGLLMQFCNSSVAKLHDQLSSKIQDYDVVTHDVTISPSVSTYALPDDFMALRLLEVDDGSGSNWTQVFSYPLQRRPYYDTASILSTTSLRYRLVGSNLIFAPMPTAQATARIWYVPTAPTFANVGSVIDFVNGWDNFVLWDVASMICKIDDRASSAQAMTAEAQRIMSDIVSIAAKRNRAEPEQIIQYPDDIYYTAGRY